MIKLYIVGSTGRTGLLFLREAQRHEWFVKKYELHILVRKSDQKSLFNFLSCPVSFFEGDLQEEKTIKAFLADGYDGILLNIANIRFSLPLCKTAFENAFQWCILVHTAAIYSKFNSASGLYKRIEDEIHQLVESQQKKITILQPTMIFGALSDPNFSHFICWVDKFPILPLINGGKSTIQPISQKDVAISYLEVLSHQNETQGNTYIISGEKPISMKAAFQTIAHQLHKKRIFVSTPLWIVYPFVWIIYEFSFHKLDYREKIKRLTENRAFPHENGTHDFGFNPEPFDISLQKEINEFVAK